MRRTSPFFMGIIYSMMGILFTYIAINSAKETIWNFSTILIILVATFDFGVAIRMFALHGKIKKMTKK
ncbi:YdiK family protein [Fredinandcohnia quinoae]|uniref:YdiK family protein n=1 Tax=Fredinandcohnia quinoae TaxID=2918902 RepID=A0AAW5E3E8_9BACI|nr:YdiK family protein [Fredinandcohnia sp. SECRCQ15]MCH1627452.1 YdiK family protein [Fredinandcohnia sp. SECRCQ15]